MKNLAIAVLVSLAALSAPAFAADVDVNVGASSDFLVRGQSITNGKPAVFGSLKFNDVLVKNAFVSVNGVVLDSSPLNGNKTLRSEFGVGYDFTFNKVNADIGVYRVFNPVLYASNYNEARVQMDYALTDSVSLYGKVAHIISASTDQDSYAAVGARYDGLLDGKLSVSAQASTFRSGQTHDFAYNNTEVTAEYKLAEGLYAFGTYSVGGKTTLNAFDTEVTFRARDIPSQGLVGIRYQF